MWKVTEGEVDRSTRRWLDRVKDCLVVRELTNKEANKCVEDRKDVL